MAGCPYCDWRYDPDELCVWVVQVGGTGMPIVWDGELRLGRASEAPDGVKEATGLHICLTHPEEPDVQRFGPVVKYTPRFDAGLPV